MAGTLGILWAAARLRTLASGQIDLADPDTLARVIDLVSEYTPAERVQIGAKAVELGADQVVITSLLNLAGGEVVTVFSRAPRRPFPWWWVAGAVAAAGVGGYAIHTARRTRRLAKGTRVA